jgi:RHS repeat-associated protein
MKRPNSGTSYYHYDGQMSTRQLTDASATPIDAYTYEAFGTLLTSPALSTNEYRYIGEQYDSHVSMYYLRARYYDPGIGRFSTPDPLLRQAAMTLLDHHYVYSENSPIVYADPTGLNPYNIAGIMLAGVLVAMIGYLSYLSYKRLLGWISYHNRHGGSVYYKVKFYRTITANNVLVGLVVTAETECEDGGSQEMEFHLVRANEEGLLQDPERWPHVDPWDLFLGRQFVFRVPAVLAGNPSVFEGTSLLQAAALWSGEEHSLRFWAQVGLGEMVESEHFEVELAGAVGSGRFADSLIGVSKFAKWLSPPGPTCYGAE